MQYQGRSVYYISVGYTSNEWESVPYKYQEHKAAGSFLAMPSFILFSYSFL